MSLWNAVIGTAHFKNWPKDFRLKNYLKTSETWFGCGCVAFFIYKRWRQPPNRPHLRTAALPQTGTRFLVGPGGAGCFFKDLEEKLDKEEGDFMVWGFKDTQKKNKKNQRLSVFLWWLVGKNGPNTTNRHEVNQQISSFNNRWCQTQMGIHRLLSFYFNLMVLWCFWNLGVFINIQLLPTRNISHHAVRCPFLFIYLCDLFTLRVNINKYLY